MPSKTSKTYVSIVSQLADVHSSRGERNIHTHPHPHTTNIVLRLDATLPNHPQKCVPGTNTMRKMKTSCRHTMSAVPAEIRVICRIHKGESQVLDNQNCTLITSALPLKVLISLHLGEAGSGHHTGAAYLASTVQAALSTSSLASRNMMCRMPASCRCLLLAWSPLLRFLPPAAAALPTCITALASDGDTRKEVTRQK